MMAAELSRLESAIAAFKARYGVIPPALVELSEDPQGWSVESRDALRRVWPQFDFSRARDIDGALARLPGVPPAEALGFAQRQLDAARRDAHGGPLEHAPVTIEQAVTKIASTQQSLSEGLFTDEPGVTTAPSSLKVKIEVLGGVAYVIEEPPRVEVEIIDHDVHEEDE